MPSKGQTKPVRRRTGMKELKKIVLIICDMLLNSILVIISVMSLLMIIFMVLKRIKTIALMLEDLMASLMASVAVLQIAERKKP